LDKWDSRFIFDEAGRKRRWSKDPSSQIGCVAVNKEKRLVLSAGYNGFPRNFDDSDDRYINREFKYDHIIHAEMNMIFNACYNGIKLEGSTVYVYGLPTCNQCALGLSQVGVKEVICFIERKNNEIPKIWLDRWEQAKFIYRETGVIHSLWDSVLNNVT